MPHTLEDIRHCEALFSAFYGIGATGSGGVTRLGYTGEEDQMHRTLARLAASQGLGVRTDSVGNTFVYARESERRALIGSHLDSVVEGGRYDGVAGVIAGLMVLSWLRRDGLSLPVEVAAFRCEESSNFGQATVGSGLITGALDAGRAAALTARDGGTLADAFAARGLTLSNDIIRGVRLYLELHIEQGKVLEEAGLPVGVVSTIAGTRRFRLLLQGLAEHSGATPMDMRFDALCAASEIILMVEKAGRQEAVRQSVATVGVVGNRPNVLNVIPGETELGVDLRGTDRASLERMAARVKTEAAQIAGKRGVRLIEKPLGLSEPTPMSAAVQAGLMQAATALSLPCRLIGSGAGHDAMGFAPIADTGMVFIPCRAGISHNRREYASIGSILDGALVLYQYLKGVAL